MTVDVVARLRDRLVWESRVLVAEGVARWTLVGAVVGIALAVGSALSGANATARWAAAVIPGLTACLVGYRRSTRAWTPGAVAEALEKRHPADNLVVTAEALGPAHPWLPRVAAAAWSRVESKAPASARPAALRAALAVAAMTAAAIGPLPQAGVLARPGPEAGEGRPGPTARVALTVVVTSPAYLGGEVVEYPDATAVDVVAGSQVLLRAQTAARAVHVSRDGAPPLVAPASDGLAVIELSSPSGGTWLVAPDGAAGGAHLLIVRVVADAAPVVRVVEPGRDRRVAAPVADLAVTLEARDDHALGDLYLRFTRVSGSGESLSFADRDVPARVTRQAAGAWTAAAVVPLASLGLEDGDLVVYRGVARDARPGAPAVESDAFIVDVGPLRTASATAGGGEDVDPEDRQAISQQMVIVKTERLHARRSALTAGALTAEAQGLAVEQRMVRAEFVFLMGGEVQDEVEEAAQAHELVEGRLENGGQAALLGATRAMSRAEARLAAGETAAALVAEREALRFLRQAFDRRRFLLRPVAERARIDPSRRLQGQSPSGTSPALPVSQPDPPWRLGRRAVRGECAGASPRRRRRRSGASGGTALSPRSRRSAADRRRHRPAPCGDAAGPRNRARRRPARAPRRCRPPPRCARAPPATERRVRRHCRRVAAPRPAMTRLLRLAAYAIAVAAVVDPQVERVEPAPVRIGVRVATAAPSPVAERSIADLSAALPPAAIISRELAAPEAPWCLGLDVCVVVGDGTVPIDGQPQRPVHVVRLAAPEAPTVVAASTAPGDATEMREARIAVAGGGEGQAFEVVVEDGGVEVGRLTPRRTGQPIDQVIVPWWPRGPGVRLLTVRVAPPAGPSASTMVAETSSLAAEVLVWDVRPSWTGTFVRRALEGDRRLIVRAASRVAPRQLVRRGLAGPPSDDDLYRARAIVVSGAAALEAAPGRPRLDRYAQAGGAVVVALDEPPVGAVQALMPGPSAGQRRELDAVPLGDSLRAAELVSFADRSGDAVLASWDGGPPGQRAVIVERRTGRGRVVVSGALDGWRWRDGAEGFDRFWQGLVVRAARASSPPLGVSWASGRAGLRLLVSSRRGIADGVWPALGLTRRCGEVTTPVSAVEGPVPGTWLADVPGIDDGCRLRAESGADQVETSWPGLPSLPPSPPSAHALETLAMVTGGTVMAAAADALATIVAQADRPRVTVPWHPMREWAWFVPFVAVLGAEWWLRRRRRRA